jgi:hypothetical protein
MPDTRQAGLSSVCPDPILKKQVTTIHADLDAVSKKRDNTVSRFYGLDGIVGLR